MRRRQFWISSPALAKKVDEFIQSNPGISMTFIMNQALTIWLDKPEFKLLKKEEKL